MKPEERRLFAKFLAYLLVAIAVMAALVIPNILGIIRQHVDRSGQLEHELGDYLTPEVCGLVSSTA